uniref:Uncharacterized protein n=2 Tax=Sphaerodactylus townsendi TaxID=933632 RepID=A0ACB8FSL6_9SAUR
MLEFLQGITANTTTFAGQGCATESVCEPREGVSVYSGVFSYAISTIMECYPAPITTNSAIVHHISWMKATSLHLIATSVMSSFCFLSHNSFL